MAHTLPPLPYPTDALEPFYDKTTLELHHGKHHAAYVEKLNAALSKFPDLADKPVEGLLADLESIPEPIRKDVVNNGGGHVNHSLFWQLMAPQKGGEPGGPAAKAIADTFSGFDGFVEKFSSRAEKVFGSGYTWLVRDKDGGLSLIDTANQDSPISLGLKPLLTVDLWEHAYYLKFQNRRPEWIKTWWHMVNWDMVQELYASPAPWSTVEELYGAWR